jgi:hypothetical protein
MSASPQIYPPGIPYRQPRPRGENSLAGTIFGALLGLGISATPIGLLAGGTIGNVLANQPLSLEAAVRTYFTKKGLPVIGFYRLGPQAAKVLFYYRDQFWTVFSRAQDSPNWMPETLNDWLYGDIIEKLDTTLTAIDARLTQ